MDLILYFIIIIAAIIVLYALARHFAVWRRIYIVVTIVLMTAYIAWRLIFTLNFDSFWSGLFSVLLVAAETMGVIVSLFIMSLFFGGKADRKPPEKPDNEYKPTVDILICTYDEPYQLVASSALAAASLPYENKRVYICDDGKREELRLTALELGLGYITREDNAHAKAGNINHALSVTNGELVMLLDADFIVKPQLITEAYPYFKDDTVGMVQFPQAFYNKDPFQLLNKKFFNEQDFFMRYIEPQLSQSNAMIHIGTNAIIRRSALAEVGGIPTDSITEDMATGILLQNAGYRTIYINKAYALGIAPFNLKDLKAQRQRWARGTVQVFKYLHPLRLRGLSLKQKTIYLELFLYWFTSFQKLIYIMVPTVYMLFGTPIVNISAPQFLLIVIPSLILFGLNFRVLIGKVRTYTSSHIYDTLMAPYHAAAVLKELLHTSGKFNVTPKQAQHRRNADLRPVVPHIVMAVWLIIALGFAAYKMGAGIDVLPLVVCAGWTVYNLFALFYAIACARSAEVDTAGDALSIEIDADVLCEGIKLHAFQMSFEGIKFRLPPGVAHKYEQGKIYEVLTVGNTFAYPAQFNAENGSELEFLFMGIKKEEAYKMSAFYVRELHAAHELDFDREASDAS